MRIHLRGMIGAIPVLSERLLPDNAAQRAMNCKVRGRELRAWRDFLAVNSPAKTGPLKTLYPMVTSQTYWMNWPEDVDVVRGPIANDTTNRVYFTGTDRPRATNNVLFNTTLAAGSLLHFDGDDGSTSLIDENTANVWAANGNAVISSVHSRYGGKSLRLDGTGDYASADSYALIASTGFNRSIWFRASSLTTARALVVATEDFKFALKISAAQKIELSLGGGASWTIANAVAGTATIANNTWYRARVAWNGATYKVYLSNNGAAESEEISVASAVAFASSIGTRIGVDHAGALGFDGHVDEWRDLTGTTALGTETPPTTAYTPANGYPKLSRILGVAAPTGAPTVTLGGAGSGNAVARAYVYTHVTGWGEEGPPSPLSSIVLVQTGQTVTVNAFAAVPTGHTGDYDFTHRRIYRIATGLTGAEYLFVAEITIATSSYVDSLTDDQLGGALPSTEWSPPPTDLVGLIGLPNGVTAGFRGNEVYLTPPFLPYAYPVRYKKVVDYPVVALGHFGTTLVIATSAYCYLLNVSDPEYAGDPAKLPGLVPCLSKRSLVSSEAGVFYASSEGLARVTPDSVNIISKHVVSAEQWQERFYPSTIHAKFFNGVYVAFYTTEVVAGISYGGGFFIDEFETQPYLIEFDVYRYGMYVMPETSKLYVVDYNGIANTIEQVEGAATRRSLYWRSKKFPHRPACFQAGRIAAKFEEVLGAEWLQAFIDLRASQIAVNTPLIGNSGMAIAARPISRISVTGGDLVSVIDVPTTSESSSVEIKVYGDGVLRYTTSIVNDKPFRLPGGYTARETEVEISGNAPMEDIILATTMSELRES